MALGPLVEVILQPIAELVLQLAGYITACMVVPVFTLGQIRVEPGPKGELVTPKFGRIRRLPGGKLIMEAELASLVGLLFWVAVAIGVYFVRRTQ